MANFKWFKCALKLTVLSANLKGIAKTDASAG